MDLPLWDYSDDQGYLTSFEHESGNNTEDHLLHDFAFGYGRDTLEEDALNEKSCSQVLKIWIDKADEDIVKLEEEILMLKCQLLWDDKDWSEQCSAALREKIDHLDILIRNLKENRENGFRVENEELPPRLHDLLKPLLENYLAKPEQTEPSTVQTPVSPAAELSNKKSQFSTSKECQITEENACTGSNVVLKTYERKSKSTELEENHPREKQNAVTTEFDANAHTCRNDEVSENFISKPITPDERGTPKLVHAESERSPDQSEPADSFTKESNTSTSIEKVNSGEKEEKSDNLSTILPGVIPVRHQYQSKVTQLRLKSNETGSPISETVEVHKVDPILKPRTEASCKVRKARVYRRSTKEDVLSVKPSVKMKAKKTKFSLTSEVADALDTEMKIPPCSMNDRTERIELKHQGQVQRRQDIETLNVNQAKLTSPLKPEGQGPQKRCKKIPEIFNEGPSSTDNLMGQNKNGVTEEMSNNGVKENLQQLIRTHLADTPVISATPILLPQTTCKKEYSTSCGMKLAKKEDIVSSSKTKEAPDGVKNIARTSTLCIKNHDAKLTCSYLREIAKRQKLRGYYKLKKEELLTRLGFS